MTNDDSDDDVIHWVIAGCWALHIICIFKTLKNGLYFLELFSTSGKIKQKPRSIPLCPPLALTNFFFYNWYLTLEGSICPYGDSSLLSRAYNTVCTQCETFCGVWINVKWHISTLQNYTEQFEGSENVLVWAFGLLISTGGRHCCPTHRMWGHGGQKMSSLSFWRPEQMELAMALVLPFEDWRPWSLL